MKGLLSANVPAKLASLVVAVMLWQLVTRIEQPQTLRAFDNVPVNFINVPENLVPPQSLNIHVDARAIGPGITVDRDEINATIDLKNLGPGKHKLPVRLSYESGNVELTGRPKLVTVNLEEWTERRLQVQTEVTGYWDLYMRGPITISPEFVKISGPQSLLDRASEARVNVDLRHIEPGAAAEAQVQVIDKNGKLLDVNIDRSTVMVRIKPVPLPPSKSVLVQPTWQGAPKIGLRLVGYDIDPNQVTVTGSAERLASLISVETAKIDLSQIQETTTVNVPLSLPPGVRSSVQTVSVRVTMQAYDPPTPDSGR